MRWSRWLLCVGAGGLIGVSIFGQTEFESSEQSSTPVVEEFDAVEEVEDFAPADVPIPAADAATSASPPDAKVLEEERILRRQYLQLIQQKSDLMDRSALREAISRTEQDIDELKANDKLQQARQLLLELVKARPETNAARTARTMLYSVPAQGYEGTPHGAPYEGQPTPIQSAPFYDATRAPSRDPVPTPTY